MSLIFFVVIFVDLLLFLLHLHIVLLSLIEILLYYSYICIKYIVNLLSFQIIFKTLEITQSINIIN